MNNNLEFENEDPSPDSIEDNHPRTNYGEGYGGKKTLEEAARIWAIRKGHILTTKLEDALFKQGFKDGAKWMQERMYNEAIEFAEWIRIKDFQTTERDNWIGLELRHYTTEELFEQFKNK